MSQEYAYYWLIVEGHRTINDVPTYIRTKVIDLLDAGGYHELTVSDEIKQ